MEREKSKFEDKYRCKITVKPEKLYTVKPLKLDTPISWTPLYIGHF
jgi:hypothetical protein